MINKKGFSMTIVIILIIIILFTAGSIWLFTKNNKKETAKNEKQEQLIEKSLINEEKKDDSNNNKNVKGNKFTKAKLSLYNTIQDSNYLTVVLYDPLRNKRSAGERENFNKAILVTYDFGEGLKDSLIKNGFIQTAESKDTASLKYYYSLLANNFVIYQVGSSTDFSCSSRYGEKDIENNNVIFYKNAFSNIISTYYKDTKEDEYTVLGTNFHTYSAKAFKDGRDSTDLIYLNIGETKDKTKDITMAIRLNQSVPYGSTFTSTVEKYIQEENFKDTVTIMEDTDKLDDIYKTYGKKINLESTIFYQDVIATEIAKQYGLNVRDKDYFAITDAKYIMYRAYGEDSFITEVRFVRPTNNLSYNSISSSFANNSFNYKDLEGNEYDYFADNTKGYLYVFKNKEYVGPVEVTHKTKVAASDDVFNHVNDLFGIKN